VVANGNLARTFNFDQGYESQEEALGRQRAGTEVNRRALDWLEEHHANPFFLYVHYIEPHVPYEPLERFRGLFEGDGLDQGMLDRILPIGDTYINMLRPEVLIEGDSRDLDLYVTRYDEEIRSVDYLVDLLLGKLAELGVEESTLVVLTSDHGESLGDHDYFFGHGFFAYESTARVPLMIRAPSMIRPGTTVESVVELVDVMPTILELLGVAPNPEIEGVSLLPALGSPSAPGLAFCEGGHRSDRLILALRAGRWKLIHNPRGILLEEDLLRPRVLLDPDRALWLWRVARGNALGWMKRWELYDVETDPAEKHDLLDREPELFAKLRPLLEDWRRQSPAERDQRSVDPEAMESETLENLRSLGYVN
jgi:arylsulfatase A-like enzyme